MLHIQWFVHAHSDFDLQIVGAVLTSVHFVPLGQFGGGGGGPDDYLPQLLVLQTQHARTFRVELHLHHRQRMRRCEVTLRVPTAKDGSDIFCTEICFTKYTICQFVFEIFYHVCVIKTSINEKIINSNCDSDHH